MILTCFSERETINQQEIDLSVRARSIVCKEKNCGSPAFT
jgi:hypothetical protein